MTQIITVKEDHKLALKEIERLFDAPQGTPEFDRLEILVTLVEAYENIHEPILPPDPIEAILYYLESRGLTRVNAPKWGMLRSIKTRTAILIVLIN